jgi:bacillithiol system protein YtxJ
MALKGFESDLENSSYDSYYYLDLIAHKALSNEIAEKFRVKHESPQLLYVENGEVDLHQSHHKISV